MLQLIKNFKQMSPKSLPNLQNNQFANNLYSELKIGDKIHNFVLERRTSLPDFNMTAYQLSHSNTQSQYLHLDSEDPNNLFTTILKTLPDNSQGTPHILEHLACCGTQQFPVRDPFMKMLKRSLSTYMNAWTGHDFTAYPFSSQNQKDFYNLLQVYLQMVYKPLLRQTDYAQEGWRYDYNEETKQLTYKGVVFNEMKGVMQSADNVFDDMLTRLLFKNHPFSFNSGGDPSVITELSYAEIQSFYEQHYHPSNSQFISYGNLDFRRHLQYLQENYLQNVPIPKDIDAFKVNVPLIPRVTSPASFRFQGPPDPVAMEPEQQARFAQSFLCCDITKPENMIENEGLKLLSYLLFETPSAPMFKALIESGQAPAYSASNGYNYNYKQSVFTIGVQGISEAQIEKVEQIITEVLEKASQRGFNEKEVEAVLHQVEIGNKIPRQNFGISVLQSVISVYNNEGYDNTLGLFRVTQNIVQLRDHILNKQLFQNLIKKYLLNNQHSVRLTMVPQETYLQDLEKEEKNRLEETQKNLSTKDLQEIVNKSQNLEQLQNSEEDMSILPTIQLSDIQINVPQTVFEEILYKNMKIYTTDQPTNGINFLRIKIDLHEVPVYIRHYLDMFCSIFPQIGTQSKSYEKMSQELRLFTTNFSVDYESGASVDSTDNIKNFLTISIACVDRNIEQMMSLLSQLILKPDFSDQTNITTILKNDSSGIANSLIDSSMNYAFSVGSASLLENYFVREKLSSARFLCNIGSSLSKGKFDSGLFISDIAFHLSQVITYFFRADRMNFIVHSEKRNHEKMTKELEQFIDSMTVGLEGFSYPTNKLIFNQDNPNPFERKFIQNYYSIPSQVNCVTESFVAPSYSHDDTPVLNVLAELITSNKLHTQIREKGGAYGGGCRLRDGVINFYSYRDPNLLETLKVYEKSIKEIANGVFSDENLREAQISVFSKIDDIVVPQSQGMSYLYFGLTEFHRENYRRRVLDSTKQDIIRVCKQYLEEAQLNNRSSQVIFGTQNADLENFKKDGWFIDQPIHNL